MNIQAKVALDKEKHPERFCKVNRCLWKVVQLDPSPAQTYSPKPDCPDGYCPRHRPVTLAAGTERINRILARLAQSVEPHLGQHPYERDREDRAVRG